MGIASDRVPSERGWNTAKSNDLFQHSSSWHTTLASYRQTGRTLPLRRRHLSQPRGYRIFWTKLHICSAPHLNQWSPGESQTGTPTNHVMARKEWKMCKKTQSGYEIELLNLNELGRLDRCETFRLERKAGYGQLPRVPGKAPPHSHAIPGDSSFRFAQTLWTKYGCSDLLVLVTNNMWPWKRMGCIDWGMSQHLCVRDSS